MRRAPSETKYPAPCCGQVRAGYILWWSFASGGVYECKVCRATFAAIDTAVYADNPARRGGR